MEVDELRYAFALYDKYEDEEIDDIFAAVVSHWNIFHVRCVLGASFTLCILCFEKGYEWGRRDLMD